jgi:hypothetical protein
MSLCAPGQSGGSLNFSEVETLESGACRDDGESHILVKYKDFLGTRQSLARGHREESTAVPKTVTETGINMLTLGSRDSVTWSSCRP